MNAYHLNMSSVFDPAPIYALLGAEVTVLKASGGQLSFLSIIDTIDREVFERSTISTHRMRYMDEGNPIDSGDIVIDCRLQYKVTVAPMRINAYEMSAELVMVRP